MIDQQVIRDQLAVHNLKLEKNDNSFQVQTLAGERVTDWMKLEEISAWINDQDGCPFDPD